MIKNLKTLVFALVFSFCLSVANVTAANAANFSSAALTRDELTSKIQEKAKQLQEIDNQLSSTKKNLESTQSEKKTLQKELQSIQGNINQLNLSIKSDQVQAQKLSLEVDSLGYDIKDIQFSVEDKKTAITGILVELQKNDQLKGNLFAVFLRNDSLADGVSEIQSLHNLQDKLTKDITSLKTLHDAYNEKIKEANSKKDQISFHQQNLESKKLIVNDQKAERQNLLVQTKNKESVFQKQVADLEKLKSDIASEVEALDAILRAKINPSILPPLRSGVLAMPIAGAQKGASITQDYGATQFAKYGYRGKWHNGVDFRAPLGTPVLAADDGTIAATGNQDLYCYKGAYGRFIVINHENNLTTLYAHLSRIIVKSGDKVKRGEVIGYSGKSGYATGPHLHLTVFAQPTFYMGPSRVCGPMPFGGDLNPTGWL